MRHFDERDSNTFQRFAVCLITWIYLQSAEFLDLLSVNVRKLSDKMLQWVTGLK